MILGYAWNKDLRVILLMREMLYVKRFIQMLDSIGETIIGMKRSRVDIEFF